MLMYPVYNLPLVYFLSIKQILIALCDAIEKVQMIIN